MESLSYARTDDDLWSHLLRIAKATGAACVPVTARFNEWGKSPEDEMLQRSYCRKQFSDSGVAPV
jgi:hypothetical protein